jgi:hypothetical protein
LVIRKCGYIARLTKAVAYLVEQGMIYLLIRAEFTLYFFGNNNQAIFEFSTHLTVSMTRVRFNGKYAQPVQAFLQYARRRKTHIS